MTIVLRIAREECLSMLRDKVAAFGLILLTVLTVVAAVTAAEHQRVANEQRQRYQSQADDAFAAQPDRHPHRVVHYGHFVFRPLSALSSFDPGIDAYTGNTLFLEGHRQNGANFGEVRQSSLLLRFGQLSPAFALQVLAPLLLIFVGHGAIVREREAGTLRVLLAQGVRGRQLFFGKLLALLGFAGLILLPGALALTWLGLSGKAAGSLVLLLLAAYLQWLLMWSLGVMLVSSLLQHVRDVLLCLLAAWVILVIVLPRIATDMATGAIVLPSKFENDIVVQNAYRALGDSHNPDDPHFRQFREAVLAQYGVATVEQLPVNYKGLLGMEGERLSSALFEQHMLANYALQRAQIDLVDTLAWIAPTLALRRLSMVAAGTDLRAFQAFLTQGERYRYALVQRLNRLEVDEVSYADDNDASKENRIARSHWQNMTPFHFQGPAVGDIMRQVLPSMVVLWGWLAGLLMLAGFTGKRLEKVWR